MTTRAPRIVMLAGGGVSHTSGGVGTLILYLMEVWAGRDDAPVVRVIDTRGQGGVAGGIFCFVRALAIVAWLAATGRASLVHAHMTTRGSVVRKCLLCTLATVLGRPTIVHMHGADFMAFYARLRPLQQRLIARTLRRARYVVVLGAAWQRFLVETVGLPREQTIVLMNGARGPQRPVQRPAEGKAGTGVVKILFLGRLGERKGVPDLIAALASPALRGGNWAATIAGDGDVGKFRRAVAAAGLADRVTVPGWAGRQETARLLAEADILALPSFHEAMPIAVIEALAYRVAIVTTPVGVIPEILSDGVTALLVPPGAPLRLGAALRTLIEAAPLRQRLTEAGHAVFMAKLDVTAIAGEMLGLYRAALAGDPSAERRLRGCRAS